MGYLLLYIYVGVCLAMMASAIWRKEDRLQFPFLAGGTALLMVCLPLAGLLSDPKGPTDAALERFTIMAILCQLASWAGYHAPWKFRTFSDLKWDPRRLAISAVALSVFGFYFGYRLSTIDPEIAANGNWTGIATIYITLAQVSRYGFVLAAILYFRSRDWRFLLAMIPQLVIYGKMFLGGRRSPTGEFFIILMTLLLFYRKKTVPFGLFLTGMVFLAVFSYNIGEIRANVDRPWEERIESFMSSDPFNALSEESMIENNGYIEVANAVNFMDAKAQGGHYNYGLDFWNKLVFGFVPAQWVGADFKRSLQFALYDDTALVGFEKGNGTCETGIAEAFMAFSYFGFALFFILGVGLRWLWEQSIRGSVVCQVILMLNILPAIMSFGLQLWVIVNGLVNLLIFAGPFLWWSAVASPKGRPLRRAGDKGALTSATAT